MAASQSARSNAGTTTSAADLKQLQEEVQRLRAYKVMAEKNLKQMGFDLQAARKQGWVSKRAEVRRKRLEKKKAAKEAKQAKDEADEANIREERKKAGLPVDPTPTPSEVAYRERVADAAREEKAERLRNRVRRMSHQLLIAAAIRQQYREITMADHSGHVVPGGTDAGPLKYKRYDARSESGMSATEAMARSFRNWVNHAKRTRFRARSRTPSTVELSSRTTGPEDTPSGSESTSSFTDDDAPGAKGLRAVVYDPYSSDEDDITDAGEELGGLADLDLDDVSDEILARAYSMVARAGRVIVDDDWATALAGNIISNLMTEKSNTPPPSGTDTDTESLSDTALQAKLKGEVKQTVLDFFQASQGPSNTKNQIKNVKKVSEKKKKVSRNRSLPPKYSPPPKYTPPPKYSSVPPKQQKQKQKRQKQKGPKIPPNKANPNDTKGPSRRAPHKPAATDRSVWDPTWWRVNKIDYHDGVWADKVLPKKQPTNNMETGFVRWEEQEQKFPYLDERLKLHPITHKVIFKPEEADTHSWDPLERAVNSWDPLNRAVTEPKTGQRAPLLLGPATIHSLARWTPAEFGGEYSQVPVQMPDTPSIEEKKRSLSSARFFKSKGETAKKVVSMADVKAHLASVASVHYPLKSPAATSIAPSSAGYSADVETPTVALYEHLESSDEEEEKLVAFMKELNAPKGATNTNGKRPATAESSSSQTKKRRTVTVISVSSSSSDSGKENGEDEGVAEEEPMIFTAAKKEFWSRPREEVLDWDKSLEALDSAREVWDDDEVAALSPSSRGSSYVSEAKKQKAKAKAVRFDVGKEVGPSLGMRDGARRALGRYGLTSARRGPYR
ncbi:hypothetical protein F4679DRAFT_68053 [Xylaria curta]|nr:hypothetical protein F4679DRAFT_68053 [Xylaria curta]